MAEQRPGRLKIKLAGLLTKALEGHPSGPLTVSPESVRDAKGAHRTNKAVGCEVPWHAVARDKNGSATIHLDGYDTMGNTCRLGVDLIPTRCPASHHRSLSFSYDVWAKAPAR